MKFASLRSLPERELKAKKALAVWPLIDTSLSKKISYLPVSDNASTVAIAAYGDTLRWQGFIDLDDWLSKVDPSLFAFVGRSHMSSADNVERYVAHLKKLFETASKPLGMPFDELSYDVLQIRNDTKLPSENQCFLSVLTSHGRVWLEYFPDLAAPAIVSSPALSGSTEALPVKLEWRLGYSFSTRALLEKLACGDVFLMRHESFDIGCEEKNLGSFSINENGEVFVQLARPNEQMKQENMKTTAELAPPKSDAACSEVDSTGSITAAIAEIPLRVDFILQRTLMTVAQIEALYRGQVFPMDQDAETRVELSVNGKRIGSGELVELNGRLGIELQDILVGRHGVEK